MLSLSLPLSLYYVDRTEMIKYGEIPNLPTDCLMECHFNKKFKITLVLDYMSTNEYSMNSTETSNGNVSTLTIAIESKTIAHSIRNGFVQHYL